MLSLELAKLFVLLWSGGAPSGEQFRGPAEKRGRASEGESEREAREEREKSTFVFFILSNGREEEEEK